MSIATTRFVAGADRFAALHGTSLPQVDELCGCFQAHLALRLAGFGVDQEDVALKAGSTQSPSRYRDGLPAGETGREARCSFPITDEVRSGTAAGGLVRAVNEIGAGTVAAIPVAGPFTAATVAAVLDIACAAPAPVTLAANVATGPFWGSHPTAPQILAYLASGDDAVGPAPDWEVGHFVTLLGTIDGAAGTLVIVADTYPSLGLGAVHLQPVQRVAAALRRETFPGDGGIVAIVAADEEAPLRDRLVEAGLDLRLWDNGSSDSLA
jgi:Family of unknown function (DUF6885)